MAVGGRHGAKAKISSPAGRARASAPLGPTKPVAPAACGPREPRGEPRKRRSPRAITSARPAGCCCGCGPSTGLGAWAFNPSPTPIEQRPAVLRCAAGKGDGR